MPNAPRRHAGRPSWMEPIAARLTPTVKAIVVTMVTLFAFYLFVPVSHGFLAHLAVGTRLYREPWQALTGLFVIFHPIWFLLSVFVLWFSGGFLEGQVGRRRFVTIYLGSGVLANIAVGTVATLLASPPDD